MNIQSALGASLLVFLLSACGGASQSAPNATSASQATTATATDTNTAASVSVGVLVSVRIAATS